MSTEKIDQLISDLQRLKKLQGQGAGFLDFAKQVFQSAKDVYNHLKKNKYANQIVNSQVYKTAKMIGENIPVVKDFVQPVDKALNYASEKGFGNELKIANGGMKNEKKGRGRPKKK